MALQTNMPIPIMRRTVVGECSELGEPYEAFISGRTEGFKTTEWIVARFLAQFRMPFKNHGRLLLLQGALRPYEDFAVESVDVDFKHIHRTHIVNGERIIQW